MFVIGQNGLRRLKPVDLLRLFAPEGFGLLFRPLILLLIGRHRITPCSH
ncbi:Uncharacterised protein [Vibrio cholerae]|nr:Uncharacterised protein [Vibrio cholerae]